MMEVGRKERHTLLVSGNNLKEHLLVEVRCIVVAVTNTKAGE